MAVLASTQVTQQVAVEQPDHTAREGRVKPAKPGWVQRDDTSEHAPPDRHQLEPGHLSMTRVTDTGITPGTTLGPYAVTAKIGEGGMGEV